MMIASAGLPREDVRELIFSNHAADMVRISYRVEVVIKVGDDEHDNEVGDYVELSFAVSKQDIDIGNLNYKADGELH